MNIFRIRSVRLALASMIAILAGCSGGGGGGAAAPGTGFSGKVVDGYISGATVFCDANSDGIANSGEMTATTSNAGEFTFAASCSGTIVATGGTDTDTGYAFPGILAAPGNSTVVTPLTTLLVANDAGNLTNAALVQMLGLPAGIDLRHTDPMQNTVVHSRTLAVQQLLLDMANFFGTQTHPAPRDMYALAAVSLAEALATTPGATLFSPGNAINSATITNATRAMAQGLGLALVDDDIAGVVSALAMAASPFLIAANTNELRLAAIALQDPLKAPIQTVSAGSNFLALKDDQFLVNGASKSLADFTTGAGITVTGLDTLSFEYAAAGTVDIDRVVNLAMEIRETGGNRLFQAKVENLHVKYQGGVLTVQQTADTNIYAHVRDHQGVEFNAIINDFSFDPVTDTNNRLTIDYDALVQRVASHPAKPGTFTADQFLNIQGSFDVKLVVTHNLNVRHANGNTLGTINVGIANTTFGVTGFGVTGKLHVQ